MQRTIKLLLPLFAVALFLLCDGFPPEVCAEVSANATIRKIGYNSADSTLSVCFTSSVSSCSSDKYDFETSRLDVSLINFNHHYSGKMAENAWETLSLPQGSELLFDGQIACNDSCTIQIPLTLQGVTIAYKRNPASESEIVLEITVDGTRTGEFKLVDFSYTQG